MTDLHTARQCFAEMQPQLRILALTIQLAPCTEPERAGLALMVAAQVFGTAAKTMGKDPVHGAREVADMIVDMVRSQRPSPLRAVPDAADENHRAD